MSQMALPRIEPPSALHRGQGDLPFVTFFEGLDFQLLQDGGRDPAACVLDGPAR